MGRLDADDVLELQQLLARYAVGMTKDDVEAVMDVFTPDGSYSAFGSTYPLADFPALVAAAPKGLFLTSTPAVEFGPDPDTATGEQPLCFVEQTKHDMRIGWYTDTYRRTAGGWRLATRKMTFLRKSGARDSGRPALWMVALTFEVIRRDLFAVVFLVVARRRGTIPAYEARASAIAATESSRR